MVVERFLHGARPVYERAAARGRLLPAGLRYVESWVDEELQTCFQLMEADHRGTVEAWANEWEDLVSFEIVPVIGSEEAAARALAGAQRNQDGSSGRMTEFLGARGGPTGRLGTTRRGVARLARLAHPALAARRRAEGDDEDVHHGVEDDADDQQQDCHLRHGKGRVEAVQ